MSKALFSLVAATLLVAGCRDDGPTRPRDVTPPAAPRAVRSVTGDGEVLLTWLANTENDVAGYRVYEAPCASGSSCPYDRVGSTTGTQFVVHDLANGVTRYFAIAAYDDAGNESALSYDEVFDTPRPEGTGLMLDNFATTPATSGYDFSAFVVRSFDNTQTDIYFGSRNGVFLMIAPFEDTEIQDAGYASSLDAVDFAPATGWSPSGTAELIVGHCYVVWMSQENRYAKFRVTDLTPSRVTVDWAYQTDTGNRELKAQPTTRPARVRRPAVWGA